ncbi:MAG: DUF1592 domain-containing protein [Deltaproteobacteria bacterium]|nr:DUF1592 domain-containing protein [Deltaproteobacteria bacterium]
MRRAWWGGRQLAMGLAVLVGAAGCESAARDAADGGSPDTLADAGSDLEPELPPVSPRDVALEPVAPTMQRLTRAQYARAIHDVLGAHIVVPQALEPDPATDGSLAVGAGLATISPRGAEQYEAAAFQVAAQALDPEHRGALVECAPQSAGARDDACTGQALAPLLRRLWRRPVTEAELAELVGIAGTAADTLGDFWEGLQFAVATALQAPSFLFRIEVGEPDPDAPDQRRRTDWELASRLSFVLWDAGPDDALLAAAEAGELTTAVGLEREARRLMASPRFRDGLRAFAEDWLDLHDLAEVQKDPTIFLHLSPELMAAAKEETLRGFERMVVELDGDFRDLFTTRETWLDRTLAALYDVPAPGPEGMTLTTLPAEGTRRGLLGQASFLALRSHPTSSSATLRGKFIRERFLCGEVPIPPVNLSTGLPPATEDTPTRRLRSEQHNTDPGCSGCHFLMDPIGLGLERFDGIGRMRWTENGAVIDPTGDVDGVPFADESQLAEVLREDPQVPDCFVQHVYRYAAGRTEEVPERALLHALSRAFAADGHRVKGLLLEVFLSPGFRRIGPPVEDEEVTP